MANLQVMLGFVFCVVVSFSVIGPVAVWLGASKGVEVALVFGFFLLSFVGIAGWGFYLDVKNMYKEDETQKQIDAMPRGNSRI